MTKNENLMVIAMEECAEIQQEISKALRFGINNHHPDCPSITNGERILVEYYHLRSAMESLIEAGYLPELPEEIVENVMGDKQAAIDKWVRYSECIGTVTEQGKNEQVQGLLDEIYQKAVDNPHPGTVRIHDISEEGKLGEHVEV